VDDELDARRVLTQALGKEFDVVATDSGEDALRQLDEHSFDLVLLDYRLPGLSGIEVLREIRKTRPDVRVIMVTAFDHLPIVIECIRAGAEDYVVKPIVIDALKQKIRGLARQHDLAAENHRLRAELEQHQRFDDLLGESQALVEMLARISKVAPLQTPVLVYGESGTGKELVARAIHKNSSRGHRPFLVFNCAALDENLLASSLFGHLKGSFTGAAENKKGLFAAAEGGTLFLDEIGEISGGFQAQLLRVIEYGEILPVGSTTPKKVDVRLVAATNRDLELEVKQKRFREDLFHRLWVYPIRVPPLRERQADIPVLAMAFLQRFNRDLNKNLRGFSDKALRALDGYAWPGNVRELKNVIERVAICQEGERIEAGDLDLGIDRHDSQIAPFFEGQWHDAKRRFEKAYLLKVIQAAEGNISAAARIAGMERTNLKEKLSAYGIFAKETKNMEPT
jgi:two-component system response regulator AtoC